MRNFPGDPVVKNLQRAQVQTLVKEIRSCMQHSLAKNFFKKERETEKNGWAFYDFPFVLF